VRISEDPIHLRSQVYNPDVVIVLEPSLLETVKVTEGLKNDGVIIINTNKTQQELKIRGSFQVHTVDATTVALNIFKRLIINTAMLGAFAAVTNALTVRSLEKAIDELFLKRKGQEIAELNKQAIIAVYKKTK
jgi:2-oxoacid:acceptor oxidoreductase gamma subunit (pyruvate/2-ketoisovalerate family)